MKGRRTEDTTTPTLSPTEMQVLDDGDNNNHADTLIPRGVSLYRALDQRGLLQRPTPAYKKILKGASVMTIFGAVRLVTKMAIIKEGTIGLSMVPSSSSSTTSSSYILNNCSLPQHDLWFL